MVVISLNLNPCIPEKLVTIEYILPLGGYWQTYSGIYYDILLNNESGALPLLPDPMPRLGSPG